MLMTRIMKDSGVEWIGEIPENWEVVKFKNIGTYINGYAFKPEDWTTAGKKIVRIQDLTGSNDNPNFYDGIIDEKYNITRGDYLISWAATLDAFIWDNDDAWLNQHIFKAIPKNNVTNKYFFWLIKESMQNMNNENKHGIMMQHVTLGVFNNFNIPLPPKNEQQKIAAFLDEKCGAIDEIISKTEQSIEEYKKLKQSVITKAITKGIRPNRPMQDSNIEWIGKIPTDWEIKKLKFVFEIKKEIAGKEGYTVLSITQTGIKPKNITSNEGQLASDYSKYQLVDKGDFAMNHMDLLTGWVDISKYDGVTSPDYRVFRLKRVNNCNRYFLYMMQLCYLNKIFYGLGQGVSGFGRWRLPTNMFLNFLIPLPPLDEQKEIADYLDEKCAEIDILIEKKQRFLAEMANYKKSLIYEYVTGKKEVA